MTDRNDAAELAKRYAAAHKASIAKVSHHLGLAKAAHAKGMSFLTKAASHMVDAKKMNKAADGDQLASHISAAHDHFNTASDHMDDMTAHLGQAMSAWGHSTNVDASTEVGGKINIPALSELTEGEVPWYDSSVPYGEKVAAMVKKALEAGGYLPKDKVDELVKTATEKAAAEAKTSGLEHQVQALTKQVELLSRQPAAAPRVKIFDFEKSALPGMGDQNEPDNRARMGALLEGVSLDMQNEHDFTKAAGTMIANMVKNGPKFGKNLFGKPPMFDPQFHGRGGTGARN